MTLGQIKEVLEAEFLCGEGSIRRDIGTACACDLMSDVLTFARPRSLLLTGLINPQVVRTAEMVELAAVCFVRGKQPEAETVSLASEKGIPLLRTGLTMFESCGRLRERGLVGAPERALPRSGTDGTPSGKAVPALSRAPAEPGASGPATGKGSQ